MAKTPQGCTAQEKQLQDANLKRSWYEQAYLISYLHEVTKPLRSNRNPSKFIKLLKTKNNSDSLVNDLTVSPDIMTFLDAFPIDYAQLVPHIEIYKVYIINKKRKSMAEELFPFEAHTNFIRDWTPEKMLTPFRGSDAGIQSIDVKMEGKGRNPVEANILDITIKFHFNDVKVLFKKWISKPGFEVSYADLIRFPPSLKKADPRAKFASFRIKLVLGWNLNKKNPILLSNNREDFIKAAMNSKVNIVADLYAHTMEFKENGSLTLTAKYKGAIEQTFSTPSADLLNSFDLEGDHLTKIKSELTKLELSFWESAAQKEGKSNRGEQIRSLIALKKKIAIIRKLNKQLEKDPKNQTYIKDQKQAIKDYEKAEKGSYPNALSKATEATKDIPSDKVYTSEYLAAKNKQLTKKGHELSSGRGPSRKAYRKALAKATKTLKNSIQVLESNMRAENLFIFVQEMMKNNKVAWISTESSSAFTSYAKYRQLIDEGALETDKDVKDAKSDTIDEQRKKGDSATIATHNNATGKVTQSLSPKPEQITVTGPSGKNISVTTYEKLGTSSKLYLSDAYTKGHKLFFFTLGDLISTILDYKKFGEGMEQLSPGFRILFGTMDYRPVGSDQTYSSDLYDLPISLNIFTNFLAKKIVGTGRKGYSFISFIHDLVKFVMNKIVAGSGAAAKGAALTSPQKVRTFKLDMTPIDLHSNLVKSDMKKGYHTNAVIDVHKAKEKHAFGRKMAINKISNTLLLHAQNDDPFRDRIKKTQAADFFLDRAQGIQHFIVGGPNRGVLKTIGFTEHNNALFNVAMYRNAQGGGISSGQGVIKPSKFSCTVKLVGNPYFFIGQLFYVDTQLISDKNFLRENIMNGGYYMVISVDNRFSADKWETTIQGILTIADSVIYKGEKSNPVRRVADEPPSERDGPRDNSGNRLPGDPAINLSKSSHRLPSIK